MEPSRFDRFTRSFGTLVTRRRGLGLFAALGLGDGLPTTAAPGKRRKKKGGGKGSPATCAVSEKDDVVTTTIVVRDGLLTLTTVDRMPRNPDEDRTSTTTVRQKKALLLQTEVWTSGTLTIVDIAYGKAFKGIKHATLYVESGAVWGNIDGRAIVEFPADNPPDTMQFQDGLPTPTMTAGRDIVKQLDQIFALAEKARAKCAPAKGKTRRAGVAAEDADEIKCLSCKGGCVLAASQCGWAAAGACAPTLAVPFAGPGLYGLCMGPALAACVAASVSCLQTCRESRACCPELCGTLPDWSCCFGGEKCLTFGTGFGECCPVNYRPCHEKNCCAPFEACRADGVCCRAGTINCRDKSCCKATDTCMPDGSCCPAEREICGGKCCTTACCQNVCCPEGQSCSPTTGACAVVCNPNFDQKPCPNLPGMPSCCHENSKCCESGDCCPPRWECCPNSDDGCCAPGFVCCPIGGRNYCVERSCVR